MSTVMGWPGRRALFHYEGVAFEVEDVVVVTGLVQGQGQEGPQQLPLFRYTRMGAFCLSAK
jgi:hypothetical protein